LSLHSRSRFLCMARATSLTRLGQDHLLVFDEIGDLIHNLSDFVGQLMNILSSSSRIPLQLLLRRRPACGGVTVTK
jgi:hypothetical protein